MVWDPVAKRDPVTLPIESSRPTDAKGKPTGEPTASATFRPWSAREKLAYEDAMTSKLLVPAPGTVDEETILLGTMRLEHLLLTIESVSGFPAEITVDDVDDGGNPVRRSVAFDPCDRRCLLALDDGVFHELVVLANQVEAPPTAPVGDEEEGEPDAGDGVIGTDADPSRKPPTDPPAERSEAVLPSEPPPPESADG